MKKNERGSITDAALITLPLFTIITGIIWLAMWLVSIAQVTQEAVFASTAAMARLNGDDPIPDFAWEDLFINHESGNAQTEAITNAATDYGHVEDNLFHKAMASYVAGSFVQNPVAPMGAFGISSVQQGRRQIITSFEDRPEGDRIGVHMRMPGSNIMVWAKLLSPVEFSGSSSSGPNSVVRKEKQFIEYDNEKKTSQAPNPNG